MDEFAIAAMPVGGGTLGICPMPGRGGDYRGDLSALTGWRPSLVLSMTEMEEFRGPLGRDLARAGICWEHLPIRDMGAPPGEVGTLWPGVSARLRELLADGERVLVHCFGGCGRSGMAVLRLMIEAGEAPEAALSRLRAARPCAVETEAQMAWARAGGQPSR